MKQAGPNDEQASQEKDAHILDKVETARSLRFAIEQISTSLQESEESVNILIDAITSISGSAHRIEESLDSAPPDELRTILRCECGNSQQSIQRAVTAFQFYDRLTQRFEHIRDNLAAVASIIEAPNQQHPQLWNELHRKVRSLYSFEQEQHMLKSLLQGMESARSGKQPALDRTGHTTDIELF